MEHQAVQERLIQAARAGEFVHYGELAKMLGIDMDNPTSAPRSAGSSARSATTKSLRDSR